MATFNLKSAFYEYIKTHAGTTLVELEHLMQAARVDYRDDNMAWHLDGYPNLILWIGWKKEIYIILNSLLHEKKIEISNHSLTALCYIIDGKVPAYPIAKSIRQYKNPHWIPVEFSVKRDDN